MHDYLWLFNHLYSLQSTLTIVKYQKLAMKNLVNELKISQLQLNCEIIQYTVKLLVHTAMGISSHNYN